MNNKKIDPPLPPVNFELVKVDGVQMFEVCLPIYGEVRAVGANYSEALASASFLREMAKSLIEELCGPGPHN